MDHSDPMPAVARVFTVVGFAGSLRRGSYNRALLRAATELAPAALQIVTYELEGIPLYNGDIEAVGAPPGVVQLRDAIRHADGLLIATPEYNHGVPGVLKNTIDWLSRPPRDSALNGKVAAVMGASPGGPARRVANRNCARHLSSPTPTRSCSRRSSSDARTRSSTRTVAWCTRRRGTSSRPCSNASQS